MLYKIKFAVWRLIISALERGEYVEVPNTFHASEHSALLVKCGAVEIEIWPFCFYLTLFWHSCFNSAYRGETTAQKKRISIPWLSNI